MPKLVAEMLVECCSDAFATVHLGGGGCARAVQIEYSHLSGKTA